MYFAGVSGVKPLFPRSKTDLQAQLHIRIMYVITLVQQGVGEKSN